MEFVPSSGPPTRSFTEDTVLQVQVQVLAVPGITRTLACTVVGVG